MHIQRVAFAAVKNISFACNILIKYLYIFYTLCICCDLYIYLKHFKIQTMKIHLRLYV